MKPIKTIYLAAGLLALLAAMILLGFLGSFQQVLSMEGAISNASPIGIMAVFAILIFGGIYFFNGAGKIIKEALK